MCVCVCVCVCIIRIDFVFFKRSFWCMSWNWLKNINRVLARPVYSSAKRSTSFEVASGMHNFPRIWLLIKTSLNKKKKYMYKKIL